MSLLPHVSIDNVVARRPTDRLAIINRDPAPDETQVDRQTVIALHLAALGSGSVDESATKIWVNGAIAYDGARGAGPFVEPFAGPRSGLRRDGGDLLLSIDPVLPFASQQRVQVRVETRLVQGPATEFRYAFRAQDLTAPQLLAATATGPKTVQLSFDEPVRSSELSGMAFDRITLPAVPLQAVSALEEGNSLVVALDTQMSPGKRYRVDVLGAKDLRGNDILPPFNRATFEGYRLQTDPRRRFDLWSLLPKVNRRQDVTGDLERFIACLQEVVDLLLADIDGLLDVFDPERAPAEFLDLILAGLGNPFPFVLDDNAKRRLAGSLVRMYRQKGTEKGIRNAVRFFLGLEISAFTVFSGTPLVLGESQLGVDWELGPSDRFSLYAFDLEVPVVLSEQQRRQLRMLVEYLKPAHTHFIDLIEPRPPEHSTLWDLGESQLGLDTALN